MNRSLTVVAAAAGLAMSLVPLSGSADAYTHSQFASPRAGTWGGMRGRHGAIHRGQAPDSAVSTVIIKVGTTANMSCTGTAPVICSPTGQNAILATSTLQKLLASSNVVVNT